MRRIADTPASATRTSTRRLSVRQHARACSRDATPRATTWPASLRRRLDSRFSGRIPFENGTIAEVLNERGWNTYAIGKWHLTPGDEVDMSAWKARWPLGRGFERFYGFLGAEANQWYPDLVYDNHPTEQPARRRRATTSKDLTNKAIQFVRDAKGGEPRQAVVHVLLPGLRTRATSRFQRVGGSVQGSFR